MPELIKEGPNIPIKLLDELENGRVVFFCGAGVSSGKESKLPLFGKLVNNLIKEYRVELDSSENQAKINKQYDVLLGLLEKKDRLGPLVRRNVIQQLTQEPADKKLPVHDALIRLSRINPPTNNQGVRLVTTNFDHRFIEAGVNKKFIDAAPNLPIPDTTQWRSLVHLHGIIKNDDGKNLVLTSADFGRAYLTDGWASRFIIELSRRFIIVFIGYSLEDAVMRYMSDALASERQADSQFEHAYAFISTEQSEFDNRNKVESWLSKGIEPIQYNKRNSHELLSESLYKLAEIKKNPLDFRRKQVNNIVHKVFQGEVSSEIELGVWALQDSTAAELLSSEEPLTDENNFQNFEALLNKFVDLNLFSLWTGGKKTSLFGRSNKVNFSENLDVTRIYLARWLANHLHIPQLLTVVLDHGGYLHPRFKTEIEMKLSKNNEIPKRLEHLWTVLISKCSREDRSKNYLVGRYESAKSAQIRRLIEEEVLEEIKPKLNVKKGISPIKKLLSGSNSNLNKLKPIDNCAHLKLVAITKDYWSNQEEIFTNHEFQITHAEKLAQYLEYAINLAELADSKLDECEIYRGQIYKQESYKYSQLSELHYLIDLVLDCYSKLVNLDKQRAKNLLQRWADSPLLLCRRLALHSITGDKNVKISIARKLLLAGNKPGIWDLEMRQEVLRFLQLSGKHFSCKFKFDIENLILQQQPNELIYHSPSIVNAERIKRLIHLKGSGVSLGKQAMDFLRDIPEDRISELSETRYPLSFEKLNVVELVDGLDQNQFTHSQMIELTQYHPEKFAKALQILTKKDRWDKRNWSYILDIFNPSNSNESKSFQLHLHLFKTLKRAPISFFNINGPGIGILEKSLAQIFSQDNEKEFLNIWKFTWDRVSNDEVSPSEYSYDFFQLSRIHPAGKLAEAALERLKRQKLVEGNGIPKEIRPYFELMAADSQKGHIARFELVQNINFLMSIDPEWTNENLIEKMKFKKGNEKFALELWSIYSLTSIDYPKNLLSIRDTFIEALKIGIRGRDSLESAVKWFMDMNLTSPKILKKKEIHDVINNFSEDGLIHVLEYLIDRLNSNNSSNKTVWNNEVFPWLKEYWPRLGKQNKPKVTEVFFTLVVKCEDSFPNTVDWVINHLNLKPLPMNWNGLYDLSKSNHPYQFPSKVLDLVSLFVDGTLENGSRYYLFNILNKIKESTPELESGLQFRKMWKIANSSL